MQMHAYVATVHFYACTASSSALEASIKFKPTQKMRVVNWKKLQQNTITNTQLALWKKESTAANSLTVNVDQIIELFSRAEIVPKAKQEEQTKTPSVVRQ